MQTGYNICNSTTQNQDSLCQTSFFTSLDGNEHLHPLTRSITNSLRNTDFCLWAPSEPNSTVADTEGEMVAWCSKSGYGTRLIPEGTLTGLQFLKTPDYIQIVGFMDQTQINMASGDYGGEMDPHGADLVSPSPSIFVSGASPGCCSRAHLPLLGSGHLGYFYLDVMMLITACF